MKDLQWYLPVYEQINESCCLAYWCWHCYISVDCILKKFNQKYYDYICVPCTKCIYVCVYIHCVIYIHTLTFYTCYIPDIKHIHTNIHRNIHFFKNEFFYQHTIKYKSHCKWKANSRPFLCIIQICIKTCYHGYYNTRNLKWLNKIKFRWLH